MKKIIENKKIIYQKEDGSIELQGDFSHETIWASLNQIVSIFNTDKSGISRHIKNIFESGEMNKVETVAKFATVQLEGNRRVKREIEYYNLDMILAIGYKVNSKKAILFRKWATKVLGNYISYGYVINKKRVIKNYQGFLKSIDDIKDLITNKKDINVKNVLELIKIFAKTWVSLDAYDKDSLRTKGYTKKHVNLDEKELFANLELLKKELILKKEASNLFARELRSGSLNGIIGNVMQSFSGRYLYDSIEEKAANLLYLIIKNHPFFDGNKRSAAYSFIWFLNKAGVLDIDKINPNTLTTLTILIAESNPKEKEKIIKLILTIIGKRDD